MSSSAPAPLPHLGLLLEEATSGIEAPASLPHLSLVLYESDDILGSLSATLEAVAASSTATVVVAGTATKTLDSIGFSATGTNVFSQGSLDAPVPLPHMALLLGEILGIVGYVSKTLENATVVSEGVVPGNEIWPYDTDDAPARAPQYYPRAYDISWFQTGTTLREESGGLVGVVGSNLEPITSSTSVSVLVEGSLTGTLENAVVSSTVGVEVVCTLTATLDSLGIVSAASVNNDVVGTTFAQLDDLTVVSAAGTEIGCSLTATLDSLVLVSAMTGDASGTLDKTLQGINANIDGSVLDDIVCVVIQTLGDLTCRAEANNGLIRKVHGGIGKPAGKARRRYVTIDGEDFVVESDEQAQALIDAAQQLAEVQAKSEAQAVVSSRLAVAKASETALDVSPVSLDLPVIKSDNDALLAELNAVIGKAYKRAEVEAEIAVRLAKQRLEDEEDNLVLLLLNE